MKLITQLRDAEKHTEEISPDRFVKWNVKKVRTEKSCENF